VSRRPGRRPQASAAGTGSASRTFYCWKAKYGGLGPSDAQRLKSLEDENRRLNKLLAESMLDVAALKDLLAKKTELPCSAAWEGVASDGGARLLPARHACRLVDVDSKTVRRVPMADAPEIRQRLRDRAGERRRIGYRRLGILLAREGITMNHMA
jgi:putative transposase